MIINEKWYCVESFHLPPRTPTYIIAGHCDPSMGIVVADSFEVFTAMERDDSFETEEQALRCANAVMSHICEIHNDWLEREGVV